MIIREDRGDIAVLRLAHGKVSAIDIALAEALIVELAVVRESTARALVITGTGGSFSAGVDLVQVVNGGPDYVHRFLPVLDAMLSSVLTLTKPVVAAVNGHAIAAGCILAAATDYRVMAEGSGRVGMPELVVGVPFPALPLQIMASQVPATVLRALVFTGRTCQPEEAVQKSLVDETCAPELLLDRAVEVATQLASIPAQAFALTKEMFVTPILQRAESLTTVNASVTEAWLQPETLATIRAYLARTLRK